MHNKWKEIFRKRIKDFSINRDLSPAEFPVSIKLRVSSGCFHREHSPRAYEIIDSYIERIDIQKCDFILEEHESGPELLVILALTTAGVTLAKSIIDLIKTIIEARSKGIQKGDRRNSPANLIVRRIRSKNDYKEIKVIELRSNDQINSKELANLLEKSLNKLLSDEPTKE